ncbi:hypothetical protein [Methanobrevibacter curvatus]|uniref:Uncharacterized protein n=1 Tax=Methanobrevibacter curvatus TaxID=49547 RepID=A0A165Z013_9EURY|nr:hypothetical protein [Methanobrevibacter curvatus]KZX10079.1 hypothetical protein MBCUR_19300 [Methanobrevibacter curvatus]
MFIIVGILLIIGLVHSYFAISLNLSENESILIVDNNNAPPFVYLHNFSKSLGFSNDNPIEKQANIIKTNHSTKYTFITKYFLPDRWNNLDLKSSTNPNRGINKTQYWYNCQSICIDKNSFYIFSSSGYNRNLGFIVKYDMNVLDKYPIETLRELGLYSNLSKSIDTNNKDFKSIKIGENFLYGHGQSLTYDKKTDSLWMINDTDFKGNETKVLQINKNTLKPIKEHKFKVKYLNRYLNGFNTLAFDEDGFFYSEKIIKSKNNPKGDTLIIRGKIHESGIVEVKPMALIKNRPGTIIQSIAINQKNNKLYLVSDGAIYSLPLDKLNDKTLRKEDFRYSTFNSEREFEGLSFDGNGIAYLLIIRGPEVLVSSNFN